MNSSDSILFEEWKNSLSYSKLRNYASRVKTILQHNTTQEIAEDPEIAMAKIESFDTLRKKEMAWSALIHFSRSINIYSQTMTENLKQVIRARKKKELETVKRIIPFKKLDEMWNRIPEKNKQDVSAKLLLDLFLHYPPLRSDMFMVKFRNYEKTDPHLENDKIVIGECIKSKMKIPDIHLNGKTIDLLGKLLPVIKGDYIIEMSVREDRRIGYGDPSSLLAEASSKYLGERMTINDFRKTAVDRVETETKFLTPRERLKKFMDLSKNMGHSYSTQQFHYNINEEELVFKKGKVNLDKDKEYEYASNGDYMVIKL